MLQTPLSRSRAELWWGLQGRIALSSTNIRHLLRLNNDNTYSGLNCVLFILNSEIDKKNSLLIIFWIYFYGCPQQLTNITLGVDATMSILNLQGRFYLHLSQNQYFWISQCLLHGFAHVTLSFSHVCTDAAKHFQYNHSPI